MRLIPTKLAWQRELVEIFLIFLLGCVMAFAFNWSLISAPWRSIRLITPYSGLMWVFFWKGNQYLVDFWNHRISWLEQPLKRFIIGFVTVLIYTPLISWLLSKAYSLIPGVNVGWGGEDVVISLVVTYLITFFLFARAFLQNWRRAAVDAEKLKREQMTTKYESLKNQVNPHFLFNSLNALTNLVYENPDTAAHFIRKLSQVYRYVLDTQSQEVVPLETELSFVNSYLFLQKIRFDEKLKVNFEVSGYEKRMITPIAVQMLLENAIKHNTVAEEEPLTIDVYVEDDNTLVVKNNLQKKNIPTEESSGMGLANIKARYEFLSEQPVEVIETTDEFIVKLPLLSLSK